MSVTNADMEAITRFVHEGQSIEKWAKIAGGNESLGKHLQRKFIDVYSRDIISLWVHLDLKNRRAVLEYINKNPKTEDY